MAAALNNRGSSCGKQTRRAAHSSCQMPCFLDLRCFSSRARRGGDRRDRTALRPGPWAKKHLHRKTVRSNFGHLWHGSVDFDCHRHKDTQIFPLPPASHSVQPAKKISQLAICWATTRCKSQLQVIRLWADSDARYELQREMRRFTVPQRGIRKGGFGKGDSDKTSPLGDLKVAFGWHVGRIPLLGSPFWGTARNAEVPGVSLSLSLSLYLSLSIYIYINRKR